MHEEFKSLSIHQKLKITIQEMIDREIPLKEAINEFELIFLELAEKKYNGKPLASYQRVQFLLAEMATKIEMIRNITYKAAWKVDRGEIDPGLNAMAKYAAGETAVWVCDKAMLIHGEDGTLDQYDIQRCYRDAKIQEIYEGAKEAEKMTISRRLF